MSVHKDGKKWRVVYRYTDWTGAEKQSNKRGFATRREALAWEREQLQKTSGNLDMTFESFVETYTADIKIRLKENTWETKEHIIRSKLLPYFGEKRMCDITPKDTHRFYHTPGIIYCALLAV